MTYRVARAALKLGLGERIRVKLNETSVVAGDSRYRRRADMAFFWCWDRPLVIVKNESGVELKDVVVSSDGGARWPLGDIAVGEKRRLPINPRGDAAVILTYKIGSDGPRPRAEDYVESSGGYVIDFRIRPDGTVELHGGIGRLYF